MTESSTGAYPKTEVAWTSTTGGMPEQRFARWYDREGEVIEAPWVDGRQTAYRWDDQLNHAVFGEQSEQPVQQALTLCGKRALEIPGRGEIDCPGCTEAMG